MQLGPGLWSGAELAAGIAWIPAASGIANDAVASIHRGLAEIRRSSTPFGALLRRVESALSLSPSREQLFALQALTSRGRTSAQVLAIYGSVLKTRERPRSEEAVRHVVDRHPAYQLYNAIGEELFAAESSGAIAAVALQALIRFCWSSRELPLPDQRCDGPALLLDLSRHAFPDERLRMLRARWSEDVLRQLLSPLTRAQRRMLDTDMTAVFDAAVEISPDRLLLLDPETNERIARMRRQLFGARAEAEERMTVHLYDGLCEIHRGTALAAYSSAEVATSVKAQSRGEMEDLTEPPQSVQRFEGGEVRLVLDLAPSCTAELAVSVDDGTSASTVDLADVVRALPDPTAETDLSAAWSRLAAELGLDAARGRECLLTTARDLSLYAAGQLDPTWDAAWRWQTTEAAVRTACAATLLAATFAAAGSSSVMPIGAAGILTLLFDVDRVRLDASQRHLLRIFGARADLLERTRDARRLYDALPVIVRGGVSLREIEDFFADARRVSPSGGSAFAHELLAGGEIVLRVPLRPERDSAP